MNKNAGGVQQQPVSIPTEPPWFVTVRFKGAKKPDFKKKVWEYHMNEGCMIVIWYDRFDGFGGPHKNIEVWPISDITYSSCLENDRPEPPRIVKPDGIIDTKKGQPIVN